MQEKTKIDPLKILEMTAWGSFQCFREIFRGYITQDPILIRFQYLVIILGLTIIFEWDYFFFQKMRIENYYPDGPFLFRFYFTFALAFPIFLYGMIKTYGRARFLHRLRDVFENAGLKNRIGKLPSFLFLEETAPGSMKLSVTNAGFEISEWQSKKEKLSANMNVYIDSIEEEKTKGTIEIHYSFEPMPEIVKISEFRHYKGYRYLIGEGRNEVHIGDFAKSPHILIGGSTGAGKSYFLRQLLTTLMVNHPECQILMADFKNGIESTVFEKLPGFKSVIDIQNFAKEIKDIEKSLNDRIEALKNRNLTSIEQFFASNEYLSLTLREKKRHILGYRQFVIIDEIAEIFLNSMDSKKNENTRFVRSALSKLARQARAAGINLILCTQRPDARALDTQIKAQMTTIICFKVEDLATSLVVLGNSKGRDIPKIPGRAIYKNGFSEVSVQTPLLTPEEVSKIFSFDKMEDSINETTQNHKRV